MKKVLCKLTNPSSGFRGFSGMGLNITLAPNGSLPGVVVPEKAVQGIIQAGIRCEVLREAPDSTPLTPTPSPLLTAAAPLQAAPKPVAPPPPPAPLPEPLASHAADQGMTAADLKAADDLKKDEPAQTEERAEETKSEDPPKVDHVKTLMDTPRHKLSQRCAQLGLDATGSKKSLVDRLIKMGTAESLGV